MINAVWARVIQLLETGDELRADAVVRRHGVEHLRFSLSGYEVLAEDVHEMIEPPAGLIIFNSDDRTSETKDWSYEATSVGREALKKAEERGVILSRGTLSMLDAIESSLAGAPVGAYVEVKAVWPEGTEHSTEYCEFKIESTATGPIEDWKEAILAKIEEVVDQLGEPRSYPVAMNWHAAHTPALRPDLRGPALS